MRLSHARQYFAALAGLFAANAAIAMSAMQPFRDGTPRRRRKRNAHTPYITVAGNRGRLTRAGRRGYVTPTKVWEPHKYLNAHARKALGFPQRERTA